MNHHSRSLKQPNRCDLRARGDSVTHRQDVRNKEQKQFNIFIALVEIAVERVTHAAVMSWYDVFSQKKKKKTSSTTTYVLRSHSLLI